MNGLYLILFAVTLLSGDAMPIPPCDLVIRYRGYIVEDVATAFGNDYVSLTCDAGCKTSGATPALEWYKGSRRRPIPSTMGRVNSYSQGSNRVKALIITNFQIIDIGQYTCKGWLGQDIGWVEKNISLQMDCAQPWILCDVHRCLKPEYRCDGLRQCDDGFDEKNCVSIPPCDLVIRDRGYIVEDVATAFSNDYVSLTCDAGCKTSGATPALEWYKGSRRRPIPSTMGRVNSYSLGSNRVKKLIITNFQINDIGQYSCKAWLGHDIGWVEKNIWLQMDCAQPWISCDVHRCLKPEYRCDGLRQCDDGFDEKNCETTTKAITIDFNFDYDDNTTDTADCGDFQCDDGPCIPRNWVCNGFEDCPQADDEWDCRSPTSGYDTCKLSNDPGSCSNWEVRWFYNYTAQRCDRFWYGGCNEGNGNNFLDEASCQAKCGQHCNPNTQFRCWRSSGLRCIPLNLVCDGRKDCSQFEDEENCFTTTSATEASESTSTSHSTSISSSTLTSTEAACDCNGMSNECYFDEDLYQKTGHGGHCVNCHDNRGGIHCEQCLPNHYINKRTNRCTPCNCDETGSEDLQCDEDGQCLCKPGVTGQFCEQCEDNYYDFSVYGCMPCGCFEAGSFNNYPKCDSASGQCMCKEFVEGQNCDRCKPGYFGLEEDNPYGCISCFCYGHASICTNSTGYFPRSISTDFETGKQRWTGVDRQNEVIETQYNGVLQNLGISAPGGNDFVFFSAPARYLGDQRFSYNQYLTYKLRIGEEQAAASILDIIIEGAGQRISAPFYSQGNPRPGVETQEYKWRLNEHPNYQWYPQLKSETFISILANITAIKIRATYKQDGVGFIDDIHLDTARRGFDVGIEATWVETCTCPEGYVGQFCESCAPGYKRDPPFGGKFAACVPCQRNNHSDQCDPDSEYDNCKLSTDPGRCSDWVVRWFYNYTSKRCDRFWYGGCNEGNGNNFLDEAACQAKCGQLQEEADVAIALHVARNAKIQHLKNHLLPFLEDMVKAADVDSGAVRFSIIVFGPDSKVQFGFDKFNTEAKLLKQIKLLKPKFIRTSVPDSEKLFETLRNSVYTDASGDRPHVPDVLIFMTDEKSSGDAQALQENANQLKAVGTHIFALGLSKASQKELKGIASDQASFYYDKDYNDLGKDELKNLLGESIFALRNLRSTQPQRTTLKAITSTEGTSTSSTTETTTTETTTTPSTTTRTTVVPTAGTSASSTTETATTETTNTPSTTNTTTTQDITTTNGCHLIKQFRCFRSNYLHCIPLPWVCDGRHDCRQSEDEENCPITTSSTERYVTSKVRTTSHQTSLLSSVPTSTGSDCNPKSPFRCWRSDNLYCISKSLVCNGQQDCPNSEDEENCPTSTSSNEYYLPSKSTTTSHSKS